MKLRHILKWLTGKDSNSFRMKEKVASSYCNYNNEDLLGIVKRWIFLLKIKLGNLYWISTEIDAEAGTPYPLLAVQMYSRLHVCQRQQYREIKLRREKLTQPGNNLSYFEKNI